MWGTVWLYLAETQNLKQLTLGLAKIARLNHRVFLPDIIRITHFLEHQEDSGFKEQALFAVHQARGLLIDRRVLRSLLPWRSERSTTPSGL